MDYQNQYDKIIGNARQEKRKRNKEIYYEEHHIIPRCLNGKDIKENLVLLTAKEHYVCHKLLTLIYPHHSGIAMAFHMMTYCRTKDAKLNHRLSSRDYEWMRSLKLPVIKLFGESNGNYGSKLSKEHLDKMAEGRRKKDEGRKIEKMYDSFLHPHIVMKRYIKTDEELFNEQKNKRLRIEIRRSKIEERKKNKQSVIKWDLHSKEFKEYMSKTLSTLQSPELRQLIRERTKEAMQNPEVRFRISKRTKEAMQYTSKNRWAGPLK